MKKQNIKELLYKFAPIALFILNALSIILFLCGFVSIFYEKINVITIFEHFGNISGHTSYSNGEYLSLFIASILFVVFFIIMVIFLVRGFKSLQYALLTRVLDYKLEYVIKLRNDYVYTLLFSAIYVGFVSFLSVSKITFGGVLVFVLGLLALTALKFFLAISEDDADMSEVIKDTAKQLLLNVVFFATCAFLLIPSFEMVIQGYRHVAFLLPSEKAFSAFYVDALVCDIFVGVVAVLLYVATLVIFFISNRNTLKDGPAYRAKTKGSFIVYILTTIFIVFITVLNILACSSSLKFTSAQIFEQIRVTLLPCCLLSIVGLIIYALDFKKIKDEE